MAISKVVLHDDSGADRTLVDLTGDTVAPETLMEGATAHDKAGNPITGTAKPGSGGPQVQSDWAENDPQNPAYVKNRPGGYETAKKEKVLESQTLTFSADSPAMLNIDFHPADGQKVTVSFDGTIYETTARFLSPQFFIGNLSIIGVGADTKEPFIIMMDEGQWGMFSTVSGNIDVSIDTVSVTVNAIPEKYIPDNLPERCFPKQLYPVYIDKSKVPELTNDQWQIMSTNFASGVQYVIVTDSWGDEVSQVLSIFWSSSIGGRIAYIDCLGTLHVWHEGDWHYKDLLLG